MKKLMSLLLMLLLILSLVACGNESIIGEWNPEDVEGFEEALMVITDTELIILGAAIPYTLDGHKIIITTEGNEETIDFTLDGDKLVFTVGEETQIFIRVTNK